MEEQLLEDFEYWVQTRWNFESMAPSEYKSALNELDELSSMSISDMVDEYGSEETGIYDINIIDDELASSLYKIINEHQIFSEEYVQNYIAEADWYGFY